MKIKRLSPNKMSSIFAFLCVLLMLNNALLIYSFQNFGDFSIPTIISFIGTAFFFISLNLVFFKAVEKIDELEKNETIK